MPEVKLGIHYCFKPMTREAFIEQVVEHAHEAWRLKEEGWKIDLTICLGRHDRMTGEEIDPVVNCLKRGRLENSER